MSIIRRTAPGWSADAGRWRRLRGAAIAASGLALMASSVVLVLNDEDDIGNAGGDVVERLLAAPTTRPVLPAEATATPGVPLRSGDLPAALPAVPPKRLVIPAVDIEARVTPVGVTRAGVMELPGVDGVGWYKFGPGIDAPAGSIVLAGHVDSASHGRGALFRLRDLKPRDRLVLHGGNGGERTFRVVGRRLWSKDSIPLDRLFARSGVPRLVIITCGGDFDRSTQRYEDNLVIVAIPEADSE